MLEFPSINGQRILNILVVVDNFDDRNRWFFEEKDVNSFTDALFNQAVPEPYKREVALFAFYSIKDGLRRVRLGEKVHELLSKEIFKEISKQIKTPLSYADYDVAFKSFFHQIVRCSLERQRSCVSQVKYELEVVSVGLKCLLIFMFLPISLYCLLGIFNFLTISCNWQSEIIVDAFT